MRASEGGAQTTDVCKSTTQSVVQHPEGLVEGVVQGSLDEAASATRVRAWRTAWPRFSNFFASNVLSIDSLAAPPVPSAAPDAFAEAGRVSQQSAGGQLQAEAALVRAAAADVISYSAAISACEKGAQPEQALQLLPGMQQQSVEPDVISYSSAISACEKAAQPEQTLQLLREMQRQSVGPNVISYNAAISCCAKGARPEQALQLLREMQRQSVETDVISYSSAISACETGAQPEQALELLRVLPQQPSGESAVIR